MHPSSTERRIRSLFPFIRFMQAYIPLPVARLFLQPAMVYVALPAGIARKAISADGVPCEWLIPRNSPGDKALLYLHGGGFVYGLNPQHLKMIAYLAQEMGMRVLVVDYRVGPEHPFPAALDDCVTAYRWLLRQDIAPRNIVIAGDSAGGNLAITTMMKLRDSGEPLPAAAACLSPAADLAGTADASKWANDPLLPRRAVRIYNTSYIGANDPRQPLISPVFGDWHGLPPLLVHAGEEEILRADALRIKELANAAGMDVRLEIYPRMWHVWQIFLSLPQARQSLDDVAQFLKSHVGQAAY